MEPTQAQLDYLKQFDAWTAYLISIGAITKPQIDELYNSIIDSMELGDELQSLPFYTKVQTWAINTGEDKVKEYEKSASDFQKAWDDYSTAQDRFEKAKAQEKVNSEIEKATMLNNMSAAERFQAREQQMKEFTQAGQVAVMGSAKARADAKRDREIYQQAHPEIPEMEQTASQIFYPFLKNLPEHVKDYYEPRFGSLFAEFEREAGPGARQKWWEKQHTPEFVPEDDSTPFLGTSEFAAKYSMSPEAALSTSERFGFGKDLGEFAGLTPEARRDLEGLRNYANVSPTYARPQKTTDPFEQFVGQYPFLEEFYKKPARERGAYPTKYAPATRWLSY